MLISKLTALTLAAGTIFPVAHAETLDAVLARMDKEAANFREMSASLKKTTYTAVLNDTTVESGQMWLKRSGRDLLMHSEMTQPEPKSYAFADSRGEVYFPKIRTVQIYDLGKNRALVDQFLLLGFGSPGKTLAKSYTLQLAGDETIDGEKTSHLVLIPKSKQVLEQFEKIELWIPLNAGHPIQQRFMQRGGDYYLIAYSDVKINPNLPDSVFRLNLPPGVKKEYPQK